MLRFGYISNGFADHSLEQMIEVLRRFGYGGIGLTLDHAHLDAGRANGERVKEIAALLRDAGLQPVVETGGRYVLDPFRKHHPNLVSEARAGRRRRADFYLRAIDIAAALGARVVSLWSGAPDDDDAVGHGGDVARARQWQRLEEELPRVLEHAAARDLQIGFEPEPGMFVESLADFTELKRRLPHAALKLTLDLGHLAITEAAPLASRIDEWRGEIVNVHIDDVCERRHEHLPLGAGEIEFAPLLAALLRANYAGLVLVELSRHSHDAPRQAEESMAYLQKTLLSLTNDEFSRAED